MGICGGENEVEGELGLVYCVKLLGVLDKSGNRVNLDQFHYRIACRDQPISNQSKSVTNALNLKCNASPHFFAR